MFSARTQHRIMFVLTVVSSILAAFATTPGMGKAAGVVAVLSALVTNLRSAFASLPTDETPSSGAGPAAAVLLLACSLFLAACPGCATMPPAVVNAAACAGEKVGHDIASVIAEVNTDLAGMDWKETLTALAKKAGWDVVDCAVMEVMGTARMQAEHDDPIAVTRLEHAQQWLNR